MPERLIVGNLFAGPGIPRPEETTEILAQSAAARIERIVSTGQASPPGFWYDQEEEEWVAVLRGRAGLRFENRDEVLTMGPGDHVLIPAHCRHRVEWTDSDGETVWLAVHFGKKSPRVPLS